MFVPASATLHQRKGTAGLLIKLVPPEMLERFGGARKYAEAINDSLTRLGDMLQKPEDVRELLLGKGC